MAYTVAYKPTYKRKNVKKTSLNTTATTDRQSAKKIRLKDMKNLVKWNVSRLEQSTVGISTIERSMLISLLNLDKLSPVADPTGTHALQQLVHDGILCKPTSAHQHQYFDREDTVTALKAWAR